ncbi:GNAT family N-acetyltransferase [Roseibium sediminicola]|uniref:GNAT family N-acetyltransferase n=1 Tax=Roseibium sediminicola TaxID=2933272 RepID=A0ABT0H2S3_9HYPH|nr:GNAT family N-acetyltransferase [Roseibium sp. CAU 1639]MCK7615982.1 GNAT family N-acetyltransferase [Roseibium sp. CAU 1639]
MTKTFLLETERLILRSWKDEDLDPFAEMCADPEVMRYFPDLWPRDRSALLISKSMDKLDAEGFCLLPVEIRETGEFIGFVGLNSSNPDMPAPFDPSVEIGWRLKQSAWGKGYASEAARAWLRFGFETVGLEEIVSFTIPDNLPSQKVMKRIGMARDLAGDFRHPAIPEDHPCSMHVLYRLSKADWKKQTG